MNYPTVLIKVDTLSDGVCHFPVGSFFLTFRKDKKGEDRYSLKTLGRDWISFISKEEYERLIGLLEHDINLVPYLKK